MASKNLWEHSKVHGPRRDCEEEIRSWDEGQAGDKDQQDNAEVDHCWRWRVFKRGSTLQRDCKLQLFPLHCFQPGSDQFSSVTYLYPTHSTSLVKAKNNRCIWSKIGIYNTLRQRHAFSLYVNYLTVIVLESWLTYHGRHQYIVFNFDVNYMKEMPMFLSTSEETALDKKLNFP